MPVKLRIRIGAALSAVACAALFSAAPSHSVHAAPAYNPGFVAFGSGGNGWAVVDVNTRQEHYVTPSGGGFKAATAVITTVRYSPDARQVAFIDDDRTASHFASLWVASADGTNAHRLADGGSTRIGWSPDGSRILFGAHPIMSVPADGSSAPTVAVSDYCGMDPQVTNRGYIFYEQICKIVTPSFKLYRPGDTSSSTVASDFFGSVSPDGTRIAWVSPTKTDGQVLLNVGEIGGNAARPIATISNSYGSIVEFGPSGDLVVATQLQGNGPYHYTISIVADAPNSPLRFIAQENGNLPGFLDWVNGSSNLPARPAADRVGGADRIATAINASRWTFDALGTPGRRAAVAVLARDDVYPDALAGTALAVQMGGPLLLTRGGQLDHGVVVELGRILDPGSTVYLLGGPTALSPGIADTVKNLGLNPVRLGGADRYATAVAIATAISGTHPKSVLLATGTNFPDALTAGPAAGQERYSQRGTDAPAGGVVLLTDGTTMPAATAAYLRSLKADTARLYAVGGPAAAAMRSSVAWWPNQVPLVGADRFGTAVKVATSALFGNGAPGRFTMAGITTGLNFPDAMSGGALAGSQGAPLLLTDAAGVTPAEAALLHSRHLDAIAVIGGPAAVSDRAFTTAAGLAFSPGPWDAHTNRTAPPLR